MVAYAFCKAAAIAHQLVRPEFIIFISGCEKAHQNLIDKLLVGNSLPRSACYGQIFR
jgi:hypothetical protein